MAVDSAAVFGYHSAASNGQTSAIKRLLLVLSESERLTRVNAYNKFGFTPLHGAIFHDHLDTAELLISMGAHVNGRADRKNWTYPLHLAALNGSVRMIKMLLAAGADPFLMDYDGLTPLNIAEGEGNKPAATILKNALDQYKGEDYAAGLRKWPKGFGADWSDGWWRVRQVQWDDTDGTPIVVDHYSDGGTPAPVMVALNLQRQQLYCPRRLYRVASQPLTSCERNRARERRKHSKPL